MSTEEKTEELADDTMREILSLADREEEIERLRRVLFLSVGVSAGLILALHLILRREM